MLINQRNGGIVGKYVKLFQKKRQDIFLPFRICEPACCRWKERTCCRL